MSDSEPRKAPQQARGRAAVGRIRAAVHEILEETGFAGLTTLSNTDHAEINVTTFYRYYPTSSPSFVTLLGSPKKSVHVSHAKRSAL